MIKSIIKHCDYQKQEISKKRYGNSYGQNKTIGSLTKEAIRLAWPAVCELFIALAGKWWILWR